MEDGNIAVLVEAKTEYTNQLVNVLKQNMYQGVKNIYTEAKNECALNKDHDNTIKMFQDLLSQIPKWNTDLINKESSRIVQESNCDWLDDLITAVFVSHTRILTSINFTKNKKKINLKIPKIEHFIHQCYIEIARAFYKIPYMFDEQIYKYDYQRNRRDCETIIEQCISETVRKQLPVKDILKEYLIPNTDEVTENKEEKTEDNIKDNLRQLIKDELENRKPLETEVKKEVIEEPLETEVKKEVIEEPLEINNIKDLNDNLEAKIEEIKQSTSLDEVKETPALEKETPIEINDPPTIEEIKDSVPIEIKEIPLEEDKIVTNASEPELPLKLEIEEKVKLDTLELKKEVLEPSSEKNDNINELSSVSLDDEINLDELIDTQIKVDELQIDNLDLDNMDDLSTLQEIYVDDDNKTEKIEKIEKTEKIEKIEEINQDQNLEPENKEIKKIIIDKQGKNNDNDDFKLNVLKKYIRPKKDYDFFSDASN